jgi:nucleoside-diphosphate-sugar epimerase
MRVLLIGGTRFIGPPVVRRLASGGHDLALFHRGETKAVLPSSVRHIRGDRQQIGNYRREFGSLRPDVVVDLIAYTEKDAATAIAALRGIVQRLVVISSMDVYRAYGRCIGTEPGAHGELPIPEDAPLRERLFPYRAQAKSPDDFAYSYEKILVERTYLNAPELQAVVLRLPAVYGPGDYQHRVGTYLRQMDTGEVVLGEAQAQWRWTRGYVDDMAHAIALAATQPVRSRVYNVGEATALTEREWVEAIARAVGWHGAIRIVPQAEAPGPPYHWEHHLFADTQRIRTELGYSEILSRADALHRSVEWEREGDK